MVEGLAVEVKMKMKGDLRVDEGHVVMEGLAIVVKVKGGFVLEEGVVRKKIRTCEQASSGYGV